MSFTLFFCGLLLGIITFDKYNSKIRIYIREVFMKNLLLALRIDFPYGLKKCLLSVEGSKKKLAEYV